MTNRDTVFRAIVIGLVTEKKLPSYDKLRGAVRANNVPAKNNG